ncbi:MAG: DUF4097 family beta strand repeat-containing protein [bacterium]|jgi:hypothetical protein|nr:MAG: hypothetical protein DIU52_04195 [bacterium]
MIRPTSRIAAVYLLPLVSCIRAAPVPPAPATPLDGRWVLRGDVVSVANLAGELRVEPGSGPDVVVEARARGPAAAMMRAELERRDEGDALRVRFAGRRLVFADLAGRSDSIEVRPHGDGYAPAGGLLDKLLRRPAPLRMVRRGPGPAAASDLTVYLPPGRRARLYAAAGTVVIARAHGEMHIVSLHAPVRADAPDGSLHVRTHDAPVEARGGAAALSVRTRAGDVDLAGVRGPRIDVRTTAGAVWASDASAPWIRLATQAGSLTLQRAQARRIALDTGAGSIAGSELTADTVSAETGAGRIVLEGVSANDVTLSTGKGDVRLVLTREPARLDVDAGGDVAVETEAGAPRPRQR